MSEPLGAPKEDFLASVRQAIGRGARPIELADPHPAQTLPELKTEAQALRQRTRDNLSPLLEQMTYVSQQQGWHVYRTADLAKAAEYVGAVATASGSGLVVRSDQEVFLSVPVDAALNALGIDVRVAAGRKSTEIRALMATAGLGVTGVDYAVTETGSVVLLPQKGVSRLVSALPPVHVALVQPQQLLASLDDLFLLLRLDSQSNSDTMGSYLNIITGPSRTADIEQTLVVGVHGPKEVHLVLLG